MPWQKRMLILILWDKNHAMEAIIEEWKPVKDFPNYIVSNTGKIKSLVTQKELTPYRRYVIRKNGDKVKKSCTLTLTKNNKAKAFTVHNLVLSAFSPKPNKAVTIDHIDRDPFNNSLNNLRWATERVQTANRANTRRKSIIKITPEELHKIYIRNKTEPIPRIALDYKINSGDLWKLLRYMHPEF